MTVPGNADNSTSEYGNRHPRLGRYLARYRQLQDYWEVAGLLE